MLKKLMPLLIKIGIISEEFIEPRKIFGISSVLVSIFAVSFSYFFVHVAFFGPPITEIFKGTYILGTAVLSLLIYKGRQKTIYERFVFLDELFAILSITTICVFGTIWIYWFFISPVEAWNKFYDQKVFYIGILGFIVGIIIYWKEATSKVTDRFTISDIIYLLGVTGAMIWWRYSNETLQEEMGGDVPTMLVISAWLVIPVSMEIARRVVGPIIPFLGFCFLVYSFRPVAHSFPGLLWHDGNNIDRISEFLMLQSDGLTGLIADVFANYMVIFVVLGAFLEKTGLGALFIDTTYRLTGQRTGGPGLTAVVSSGLFGMISGSGVANVVTTGTFTIPLMKRVGYRSEFAGAVEASASTGGAYMPPIMGSGAFLLAQFTEISYFEVIKYAILPAILYYLSVGYIVYIRAVNRGLTGVPVSELPLWSKIIPRLYLLIPIPLMVYYLVAGDSAFLAAFKTICAIVLLKTTDLLTTVQTPYTRKFSKPILILTIVLGIIVYFFGLKIGAPFSWFADTQRGLNFGDAIFWTLAFYTILKICEIFFASLSVDNSVQNSISNEESEIEVSGSDALNSLKNRSIDLVKSIWISLESGAKSSVIVGSIAGVLSILLSTATQSDLPGRVSDLLIQFSFGLLPMTIFWIIIAGYIVGMGLPIAASYVVLVIFGVLSLTNLGVPTLAAHLICYWVAVVSAVTPPVALAAYAASAIASSDPIKTGFQAMKLSSWIFIMPFLFVYTPLLLTGTYLEITITVIACLLGIVSWASFMENFLIKQTKFLEWILLFIASVFLLLPIDNLLTWISPLEGQFDWIFYFMGAILLVSAFLLQTKRKEV